MDCIHILLLFLYLVRVNATFAEIDKYQYGDEWFLTSTDPCRDFIQRILDVIKQGHLTKARQIAQTYIPPKCWQEATAAYRDLADSLLSNFEEYQNQMVSQLKLLTEISRPTARQDDVTSCWNINERSFSSDLWDKCCSPFVEFHQHQQNDSIEAECIQYHATGHRNRLCCELHAGSSSHLRLPALQEISIVVRLTMDNGETVRILLEQDGFLRQFDMSTVLWPSSFLLSLCIAAPIRCGLPELLKSVDDHRSGPIAIELGSGIGLSTIAMAKSLQNSTNSFPLIIATDREPQALALTFANSHFNTALESVVVRQLNHFEVSGLETLKEKCFPSTGSPAGFSVVLGSSLMSLFEGTENPNSSLWIALDLLLDRSNENALALFAHTKAEPILPPRDGSYRLVRRISGDVFQLRTRASASSDFEISAFQRQNKKKESLKKVEL
jgi:hypothetical protein